MRFSKVINDQITGKRFEIIRKSSKRSRTPNHRGSQIFKSRTRDVKQMIGDITNNQDDEDEKMEDSLAEFDDQ